MPFPKHKEKNSDSCRCSSNMHLRKLWTEKDATTCNVIVTHSDLNLQIFDVVILFLNGIVPLSECNEKI